jgi:hypothetical protein
MHEGAYTGACPTQARSDFIQTTMKDWHSEEEIKAQLRELTNETRKLRHDLYQLIRPSKALNPRAFTHDHAASKQPQQTPVAVPPESGEEP